MEVTKSCVKILTFERKLWKVVWYPFKWLISLGKWANWCIIRSLLRITGVPIVLASLWFLYRLAAENTLPLTDTDMQIRVLIFAAITSIFGSGCVLSWIDIPEREQGILNGVEE